MFGIYILLIIIAVGVLLISEKGQALLRQFISLTATLTVIGIVLVLLILVVVLGIGIWEAYKDDIINGSIGVTAVSIIVVLFVLGEYLYNRYKEWKVKRIMRPMGLETEVSIIVVLGQHLYDRYKEWRVKRIMRQGGLETERKTKDRK